MTDPKTRIVIGYAIWATICAAAAGFAMALIHTWFFSYHPGRFGAIETLVSGIELSVAIAAGQGAVALVTGNVLAHLNRALQSTVLLGLLIGAFDFVMYFLQMAVPATELNWIPDLAIIVAVTILITALGSRRVSATMSGA
ncbi:MAG TPA: hypothetical protein VIV83_04930 [Gemmatimonadales bacterium]|jgi:hypothetical protein